MCAEDFSATVQPKRSRIHNLYACIFLSISGEQSTAMKNMLCVAELFKLNNYKMCSHLSEEQRSKQFRYFVDESYNAHP